MDAVSRFFSQHWVRPDAPDQSLLHEAEEAGEPADTIDIRQGGGKPVSALSFPGPGKLNVQAVESALKAPEGNDESTGVTSLPSNLELSPEPTKRGRAVSLLMEGLFTACSLLYLGGCALAAVIPNMIARHTKKPFSEAQINEMKNYMKPGDIILTKSDMHRTFYFLVKSTYGHDFSHAATYVGDGKVIDSYDRPDRQDMATFFSKMTDIAVLRPRYTSEKQVDREIRYLEQQIGKEYDLRFKTDDVKEFYCSELTLRGLEASGVGAKVPGHSILGHAFVLPDDFINSKDIDLVKVFHSEEK